MSCRVIQTIEVGFVVDYLPPNAVIDTNTQYQTGTVTQIYDCANLEIYDRHVEIGTHVVTYGGWIRYPSVNEKWSSTFPFIATDVTADDAKPRYAFIPGKLKDGVADDIRRISATFKKIAKQQLSPSISCWHQIRMR